MNRLIEAFQPKARNLSSCLLNIGYQWRPIRITTHFHQSFITTGFWRTLRGKNHQKETMPPEVPYSPYLVTPLVQYSPPTPITSQERPSFSSTTHKYIRGNRRMKLSARKLIPVLVLILVCASVLRLLRIAITTSSSPLLSAMSPSLNQACTSSTCSREIKNATSSIPIIPTNSLTAKESQFLRKLVKKRVPCNLLIFGLDPQYLDLSSVNSGGKTIILEDDPIKLRTVIPSSNSTQVYKVEHGIPANQAYDLLRHARKNPACAPGSPQLQGSKCQLALASLPPEVYETNWELIIVDGPRGDAPEVPGRMAVIYTASLIARASNSTNVVVHDVDRTIEQWFSWEFLCEENLISSKGKFWNFKISDRTNSTAFCTKKAVELQ